MNHRIKIQQARGIPFNQVMLKFFGYLTLFGITGAAIIAVLANYEEIDKDVWMAFDIIGFLSLVSFSAWRVSKMVRK